VGIKEQIHVCKRIEMLSEMIEDAFTTNDALKAKRTNARKNVANDEEDLFLESLVIEPSTKYLRDNCFKVSALKGIGMKDLKRSLLELAVQRPWLYHSSAKSDRSDLQLVEEIIREKLYRRLNQELPYQVQLENRGWTPFSDKSVRIDQDLIVPRKYHIGVLYGRNGDTLREISRAARLDIQKLLGHAVHLYLYVRAAKK
jgi:GTP-binding protein Era